VIATDSAAQKVNREAVDKSAAVAGDDGLVYLMRATSPAIVYAISPAGEVIRKIASRSSERCGHAAVWPSSRQEQISSSVRPQLRQ